MRIQKNDIPTKIDVPGAHARQLDDFGDATGYGNIGAEYFSLGAGTDIAPLLQGLADDACHAPHWGFVASGEVVVTYTDGREETCSGDDLFYWPPGHSVRVVERRRGHPLQPPGRARRRDGPHALGDGGGLRLSHCPRRRRAAGTVRVRRRTSGR